jgi:hypothetical protein
MAINPKPFLRVKRFGFIEEPASTTFSFILFLMSIRALYDILALRKRMHEQTKTKRLVVDLWVVATALWAFTYFSSTLFHIHETK